MENVMTKGFVELSSSEIQKVNGGAVDWDSSFGYDFFYAIGYSTHFWKDVASDSADFWKGIGNSWNDFWFNFGASF